MYIIKYGDKYLHNPKVGLNLLNAKLDSEDNSCGFCDFSLYPGHPLYGKLKERDSKNPIMLYEGEDVLFSGFIYEIGEDFNLNQSIKCRGDLDYLKESRVRPYSTRENNYGLKAPDRVDEYFNWLIQQHNSQVDESRRFVVGINQGYSLDSNNFIYRENKQFPSTLEEINEKIISSLGGYIRVRWKQGIRYIDLISKWNDQNSQIIQFGKNLTDYQNTVDTQSIATYIIPLGARLKDTNYSYVDGYFVTEDTEMNPEKEYYTLQYEQIYKIRSFEEGVVYLEKEEMTFRTSDSSPVEGINYYTYLINGYVITKDTELNKEKEYYTAKYYSITNLENFEEGIKFYESREQVFVTSDTKPVDGIEYYVLETVEEFSSYRRVYVDEFEPDIIYYEKEYEFFETTDSTPVSDKTYYYLLYDNFSKIYNLGRFKKYETYYEYYSDDYKDSTNLDSIFGADGSFNSIDVFDFSEDVVYFEKEDRYFVTEDTEPDSDKIYYNIAPHQYNQVGNLGRFRIYELYLEYFESYDQSEKFIDISDYPDEDYNNGFVKKGDMIYHSASVQKYGWIGQIYQDSDIHDKVYLKNKAINELQNMLSPIKSIEVKAVDMHFVDTKNKSIKIGEYVRIESKPHNLDGYFLCLAISLDLNNPQNSIYSFGSKIQTLTESYIDDKQAIQNTSNNVSYLSNQVNSILQIVNNITYNEQTKTDLTKLKNDINTLLNQNISISTKLKNEINSRIQNDDIHDEKIGLIENKLDNYIMRHITFNNTSRVMINNSIATVCKSSFAVNIPTKIMINFECLFNVDTEFVNDVYDIVTVRVLYLVDGRRIETRTPLVTYNDGKYVLNTVYLLDMDNTNPHTFEIQLEVSGGTIDISSLGAYVIMSAQTIHFVWDGKLEIEESLPIISNPVNIGIISENFNNKHTPVQSRYNNDNFNFIKMSDMLKTFTDNISVTEEE